MDSNRLYESILSQAKEKAGGETFSCFHLLYSYIRLVTLNDTVLETLFDEENEKKEIDRIKSTLDGSGLDYSLAKTALPLMWDSNVLSRADAPSIGGKDPSELLSDVLNRELPELELLKVGSDLDKVLEYIEEHRPAEQRVKKESNKESDAPKTTEQKQAEEKESVNGKNVLGFAGLIDRTREIDTVLQEKIYGQEDAIHYFLEGYFQSEFLKDDTEDARIPSFLYAGPPGVGKTYLAVEAAKLLNRPYRKFDMTEYIDVASEQTFRGVPKSYRDPKPGEVTSFVKDNPNAILIFDEIEKAHKDVIHLFLQILEGGTLSDACTDQIVSFKDTLIIFTTNVGKELYEENRGKNLSSLPTRVIINALGQERDPITRDPVFPPALCSRFSTGNVVMFNHLNINHLVKIARRVFEKSVNALRTIHGYEFSYDERLPIVFLFSLGSEMDARTVTARAEQMINRELYELGRHMPKTGNLSNVKEICFKVDLDNEPEEIKRMLQREEDPRILIVADKEKWGDLPLGESSEVVFADNAEFAVDQLQKEDYSFVLADPYLLPLKSRDSYLSLDDFRSEGMRIINEVNRQLPDIPLFLMEEDVISEDDKMVFHQRGIRGFIGAGNRTELADSIMKLIDELYLQRKAMDLSGRGRVLSYNTSQKISDDGKKTTISLYDFRVTMAVEAGDRKAILDDMERPTEKFDDVIGAEDAKAELKEFIHYLKSPRRYQAEGKTPPKGVLLYGPPGTGKTMLARALAGESDVSFFPTAASSFSTKWAGESEKNIRELFRMARSYAPSVIFIDEIDAIGKERTGDEQNRHTEGMLNALLVEMDGFKADPSRPVFVLAATNYDLDGSRSNKRAVLDPALTRRFDNRIYVDLPTKDERERYIKLFLEGRKHEVSDEAIRNLAGRMTGQSLAIMKSVLELASRNASKESSAFDDSVLLNAMEEYMYGEKKEHDPKYYKSVAIHESGHAYISWLSGDKPSFVSIVSRGSFGGYMQSSTDEDIPSYNRDQLLWKIRVCLAGRAAEMVYLGEDEGINTGVSSDLRSATEYALSMICHYGMSEQAMVSLDPDILLKSPASTELIDEVDQLLRTELEKTKEYVEQGRDKIDKLVEYLMEENQAIGEEIDRIFTS